MVLASIKKSKNPQNMPNRNVATFLRCDEDGRPELGLSYRSNIVLQANVAYKV